MSQISALERSEYRNLFLGERSLRILPGQYFDAETGTHYNYFRDYDPSIGRYVESDPLGLVAGLNTYGYIGRNPLFETDSFGLSDDWGRNWDGNPGPLIPDPTGEAQRRLAQQLTQMLRQLCDKLRNKVCNPPKGTQCYELNVGHEHKGKDPHYHTWQMNQDNDGDCIWNKMRSAANTHDAPPPGMSACVTYPSWFTQVKGR